MKICTNKNLIQKITIALVCIILTCFCLAPRVQAADDESTSPLGTLGSYIKDFATALADVMVSLVQLGFTGEWIYAVDTGGGNGSATVSGGEEEYFKADLSYPVIQISPEIIFADEVEALSINFIGGTSGKTYILNSDGNVVETLRSIIASWYVTLRTIAIVGLLSVLIYIGIRIMISSTSQDRAKYKQRLVDWLVAFCLLFVMHYVMAGIINIVGQVNDVLSKACNIETGIPLNTDYGTVEYTPSVSIGSSTSNGLLTVSSGDIDDIDSMDDAISYVKEIIGSQWGEIESEDEDTDKNVGGTITTTTTTKYLYYEGGTATIVQKRQVTSSHGSHTTKDTYTYTLEATSSSAISTDETSKARTSEGKTVNVSGSSTTILYFINYARLYVETADTSDENISIGFGYLIIYMVLAIFTVQFALRYMKRVIYMAFLTLMAPLVALTYPLDKMRDRKSARI